MKEPHEWVDYSEEYIEPSEAESFWIMFFDIVEEEVMWPTMTTISSMLSHCNSETEVIIPEAMLKNMWRQDDE